MKIKSVTILAAVAVLAVAGAAYVTLADRSAGPGGPPVGEKLYPDLAARLNDVATIAIARADGGFTLARGDRGWRMVDRSDYPVPFDRVRKLLLDLAELRTLEAKTATAASYAALEVEDLKAADAKSTQVTLKDARGGEVASLIVGKGRFGRGGPAGDGTYVRKAAEAQSWLVRGRLTLDKDPIRWLDRKIVDVARERVRAATTLLADGTRLTLKREKPGGDLELEGAPPEGRKVKSAYDRNLVGGMFESLELEDVQPAAKVAVPADAPHAEISTFDGLTLRAQLAEVEGKTWVRFTASAAAPAAPPSEEEAKTAKLKAAEDVAKEAADATERLGPWAYRVPDWKLEIMKKKLEELLEAKDT